MAVNGQHNVIVVNCNLYSLCSNALNIYMHNKEIVMHRVMNTVIHMESSVINMLITAEGDK